MANITLPWAMERDRIEQIKANSVHIDDNFNTLLNAVNNKLDKDGSTAPTSNLVMNNHKITGLALATDGGDATSKGYVDSAISAKTQPATKDSFGVVKVGSGINVASGVISVSEASTSSAGTVKLGKTDTITNAATKAVRQTILTNTVPTSGEDGVIYFVYSI